MGGEGAGGERLAKVVRLPRARAPYGMDRHLRKAPPPPPAPREKLWSKGRLLDPDGAMAGLLRDGDLVTLEAGLAGATVVAEPGGIVEVRVVGGPAAGSVHRLGPGAHVIGSSRACAVAVPDGRLPPEALVVRVTPDGVSVEPVPAVYGPPAPNGAERRRRWFRRRGKNRPRTGGTNARRGGVQDEAGTNARRGGAESRAGAKARRGDGKDGGKARRGGVKGGAGMGARRGGVEDGGEYGGVRGWYPGKPGGPGAGLGTGLEAGLGTGLGAGLGAGLEAGLGVGGSPPLLDGCPLEGPVEGEEATPWPRGALVACGLSAFTLVDIEAPDAHLDPRPDGGYAYNRPPRLRRPDPVRRLEVPAEPRRGEGVRLQLLAAFLPAVLGLGFAFVFQMWYFLLFALMTPLIMIGQWWSDKRHGRKQYRQAVKEYKERLAAFDEALEAARAADEVVRRAGAPDPAELLLTATGPRRRLWERRIHDADALRLRVGLADLPADLELVPERGAPHDSPVPDPPLCHAVPVALAMRRLGVAGVTGSRDAATGLVRWLVGQAAALHSPRDLAIVVLSAHADGGARWSWTRWLPHCAPHGVEDCVALIGADPEAAARRVAELTALIDERLGEENGAASLGKMPAGWDDLGWGAPRNGRGATEEPAFSSYDERPYDVLVVLDGAQVLRALPGMPQVLRQGPRAGVYTLALDENQRLLPEECATVAACGPDGLVRLGGGGLDALGDIRGDQVPVPWCERLARSLAPIRDVSREDAGSALPGAARLLDLLDLPNPTGPAVARRWRGATTRAVIGAGPDGPFAVDLSLDGPHALIAGTTGAGKSELLQTLICSLAAANRPDEMTFVLIDYKGGAAFKECVRLPHTVGMVTDLDGHLTGRALSSLAAEIRRRERLLLAAGAKDIEDYQELAAGPGRRRAPLPRLVLIIDEFAALVTELPDFVTGLVDIARRGRSLGIHLILATQRPGGVVTADIQANTSLRIALRVTEAVESSDIIDRPDAAHISKSTPGRCYVKSGAGGATAVQTARIGGRRSGGGDADGQVSAVTLDWRALGHPPAVPATAATADSQAESDLSALTQALIDAARLLQVPAQPTPWLDPLPEHITLDGVRAETAASEFGTGRRVAGDVAPLGFGLTDLPWVQGRRELALDLAHGGHLLIAGAPRSGRSTALRTLAGVIARQAGPGDVHVHAIDCGSGALLPLVALPHCGAVVTRDQLDRVERLIGRLRAEVGRRQELLASAGYASLTELRAAGHDIAGQGVPPWLVLMLDRWEGFLAAFENYDYGRLIDAMLQLLREGPAVGLRAVVTADRSGLLGQVSTVFDDRLVLRLADPSDYGLVGLPLKDLPSSMPPGRGLTVGEQGVVESQIALLAEDPAGPAQVAALQALARTSAAGGVAELIRVDALPMRITVEQAMELSPSFVPPSPLWALLGVGGDALEPLGVDLLAQGPGAVIAGPARSGRSSALLAAARSLLAQGTPLVVVAPRRSPLRALAEERGVLAVLGGQAADLPALVAGQDRYVVLVDDAELVSADSALGMALEEVLRSGRDAEHGLIIAGTTGDLTAAYRGFVAEARKSRTGLLLSVQSPADGDLFNVRLPRGAVGGPSGRGLLVTLGTAVPVQAALPS
ncbi:FtsK/SpoIIIE domain-containing protein [Microtetraspora sp. NBRC 13810]|uniref:FtsK/SpoIIIE domain-containing protein n=1 Tax=Microtetraspora sp. NBRC 13810 TaxID=3030990 RepID=UPI0025559F8D|nr:FtsK/SpoIIIE domain-containing protein [Microtetraspora sp. NBRC 13810]